MLNDFAKNFSKPSQELIKIYLEVEKNPIKYLLADILEELKERRKENERK